MKGLIGVKLGMTRIFTEKGFATPVTIVKIDPHTVIQVKNINSDGYCAYQVTTGTKKLSRVIKPEAGHFVKSGILVGSGLWEFRIHCPSDKMLHVGQIITVSLFNNVQKVDVTAISKGKGFSGTVKRWNFRCQDASHGNSLSHRVPGSIGQNQTPGKVFKGKKMPGRLGNVQVTVQNLDVVSVDLKRDLLFVKGSIPGEISGRVRVQISSRLVS